MANKALTMETPEDLKRPALVSHDRSIAWVTHNV